MTHPFLRKQIYLPQDHGSWVFIFSPLLIGLAAGGRLTLSSLYLVVAAMAAFLIRQPVTILVKGYAGRRPRAELPGAYFWIGAYGLIGLLALAGLIAAGYGWLLALAVPAVPVFAWHLWLVSRRDERRQVNVEIVATGVLALAAPAAYWVGTGQYDPTGWWLWLLVWFQTAASIVYAYLRLEQRDLTAVPPPGVRWRMGLRALGYTTFNLLAVLTLGAAAVLPRFLFVPYLVQWLESIWGTLHPAVKWKPTRIGIRQLIVSTMWTILFMLTWRL